MPVNVPASNGSGNSTTPGQQAAASFSPGPPSPASSQQWSQTPPSQTPPTQTAPPASSASQQWSQTPPTQTPPPASAGQQWTQTPNASFPASAPVGGVGQPQQRSILPKLIGIVLVLILLVGIVVVGGVVYVGYKVRQKTRGVTQNLSRIANENGLDLTKGRSPNAKGALQGLLGALSGKTASADGLPVFSASDAVAPCGAFSFPAQDSAKVPFKPGTIFTTAWGVKYGDVEARNSVDSIDDSTVTTTSATQEYKDDNGRMSRALTIRNQNCNTDYQSADKYITVNSSQMPRLMHDLTRYRLSDKTFQEIRSNGQTNLQYVDIFN
ncbi:MAG TPA: hypothetical protein VGG59_00775, partial [Acidobacteriaceae bacterium]